MRWSVLILALAVVACGRTMASERGEDTESAGEPIEPPFEVSGDAEGLILTWYDDEGPHTSHRRSDIPEESRARVRVDSLDLAPEQREPNHVYVADLNEEVDGRYAVLRFTREAFDELLDEATGAAEAERARVAALAQAQAQAAAQANGAGAQHAHAGVAGSDVIIYGASWCGACRQAARYLSQRGVPFEEKDIERDQGARAEMMTKARAAGVRTNGIPVIDFRGSILTGFDQRRIDGLIQNSGTRTL